MGTIPLALLTLAAVCGFADMLYGAGEYEAASIEYMRGFYEAGDTLSDPASALRLARCHQEAGRPDAALGLYLFLSGRLGEGDFRASALMGAATIYEECGLPGSAREMYAAASAGFEDPVMRDRCAVLAALSLGRMSGWDSAVPELEALSADGSALAGDLLPSVRAASDPPRRSPAACALASAVLPGLGQAACGHWMDGLTSLLTTGAAGALLAVSIDEEDTAGTVFFGWLALSLYGGGIAGAARGAGRWNAAREQDPFPPSLRQFDY